MWGDGVTNAGRDEDQPLSSLSNYLAQNPVIYVGESAAHNEVGYYSATDSTQYVGGNQAGKISVQPLGNSRLAKQDPCFDVPGLRRLGKIG